MAQNDGYPPSPFAGWSPIPGTVPPISEPHIRNNCCPIFPQQCSPCTTGKCVVPAQQPVVPVPVYQEIQKRDRIIEVPQTVLTDKIIPRLYQQEVYYDVPKLSVEYQTKNVNIPRIEFREKIIEVPVPVGYNFKVVSKWETREVPKVIPKYVGKQEIIYVDVPQIKMVEKQVEKETNVYVGEKFVKKTVYEEEPIEVIQYKYVEKEEEVPVYKYKPVFDVEVDIPPPLIVPVPVRPREVRLEPERMTLEQWKAIRRGSSPCCAPGGASACCAPGGTCGEEAVDDVFSIVNSQ